MLMSLIRPFRGLRPAPGRAGEVIAPPYDVMNAAEARAMVEGRPLSFLHVSRPEIDLPVDADPYSDAVYAKGAENLRRLIAEGVLLQDAQPCYYAYRLVMNGRAQTGLVLAAGEREHAHEGVAAENFGAVGIDWESREVTLEILSNEGEMLRETSFPIPR
jgi:uncharacterized protein (DUF1015 family)